MTAVSAVNAIPFPGGRHARTAWNNLIGERYKLFKVLYTAYFGTRSQGNVKKF